MENQKKSLLEIKNYLNSIYQTNDDSLLWDEVKKIAPQTDILLNLMNYEKKQMNKLKRNFMIFKNPLCCLN